jgi:hypothetical protein
LIGKCVDGKFAMYLGDLARKNGLRVSVFLLLCAKTVLLPVGLELCPPVRAVGSLVQLCHVMSPFANVQNRRHKNIPGTLAGTLKRNSWLVMKIYCTITRIIGASKRTRTVDLLITNQLLYQLSYAGIGSLV